MLGLLGAAGTAQASSSTPTGAPSSASSYKVGGKFVGLQWTNGDGTAATKIFFKDSDSGCPSGYPGDLTLKATVSPGATSWESEGDTDFCNWFIVHYKGGSYSEWTQVTAGESASCPTCPL